MSEMKNYVVGQTVYGTVTGVNDNAVYLEIEEGVKAVIYVADILEADNNEHWNDDIYEGSDFSAQVKSIGKDRYDANIVLLTLSTKLAVEQEMRAKRQAELNAKFAALKEIKDKDEIINAKVDFVTARGVDVKYNGVKLFLSYKQTKLKEEDFRKMKGQEIPCLIVYIDEEKHSAAVSHDAALRKMKRLEKVAAWDSINVDDVLDGKVVSLMQYGAIVELKEGLASGLLHISEVDHLPVKEITKYSSLGDINSIKEKLYSNERVTKVIINIISEYIEKLSKFKLENKMFTFNDIASLAIKILEENENVRNEIKYSFKEIMIDEYQDNSDLDDEFFTKIANNNLFLVGDVKQSIYGFKGANPNKFLAKYNIISERNYEEFKEEKYTMNINYRSRREILDGVNRIFENYMDFQFGGVDYKFDHHELVYDTNITYDNCEEPKDKDKGIKSLYALTDEELVEKYNLLTGENKEPKFAKDNNIPYPFRK